VHHVGHLPRITGYYSNTSVITLIYVWEELYIDFI